jgi:hypothetical protein
MLGAPEQRFAFATAHDGDISASWVMNAMLQDEDDGVRDQRAAGIGKKRGPPAPRVKRPSSQREISFFFAPGPK